MRVPIFSGSLGRVADLHFSGRRTFPERDELPFLWVSYAAAVWHRIWPDESRRISLSEWIHGDSILLLGQATAEGSPNRPLNQLLIQRLAELLDKEPARRGDQTWVILDELTDLEYVRRLDMLLRKGRSRGVACVLGFQTWSGMVRAFGEALASEITALCGYKSFLPVNDPPTAKWAADHFGDQELLEYRVTRSESTSQDGKTSTSQSRSPQQVKPVEGVPPPACKTVFVAPDSDLHLLSFATLRRNERFLCEGLGSSLERVASLRPRLACRGLSVSP